MYRIAFCLIAAVALTGCSTTGTGASSSACKAGDPALAGHYYLNGVMEVGSELLLRKDGSFAFMLAYGANDQYGTGCWVRTGDTVHVIPVGRSTASRTHTSDDRGFSGLVLVVDGKSLLWNIAGSGHVGRYER
jgi:hypothetical protein